MMSPTVPADRAIRHDQFTGVQLRIGTRWTTEEAHKTWALQC